MPAPPTLNTSRRLGPAVGSQTSFPACPGILNMALVLVGWRLAVEEEGGGVDQGPSEVLGTGESALGELLRTEVEVLFELIMPWVGAGRFFKCRKLVAEFL